MSNTRNKKEETWQHEEPEITPEMAFGAGALEVWLFLSEYAPWMLPEPKPDLPVIRF